MTESIDFKIIRKARVCLRDEFAGVLKRDQEAGFLFQYDSDYVNCQGLPIATSFPLRKESYTSRALHPFFDNLIPEGWLLQHTEKMHHIDRTNRFALLMATGQHPLGAVTVHPVDESGQDIGVDPLFKGDLEHQALSSYTINALPHFNRCPTCFKEVNERHLACEEALWGTTKALSIALDPNGPLTSFARVVLGGSISGAQRKGLFALERRKGLLVPTPIHGHYILKPTGDYPELPENEHVTMAIAKALGFDVPPFSMLNIEGVGYVFVIKRFDRVDESALMLEDMGQVIRVPSVDKYDSSYEKVAKAIRRFAAAPKIDLNKFYRRLLFCYFTGNADMHLKNWSLLENIHAKGTYKLSPCYDLSNTRLPIPGEKIDIGLTLNGKSRNLQRQYFQRFGEGLELSQKEIQQPFDELEKWLAITQYFVSLSLLAPVSKKRYLEIVDARYAILKGNQ